MRLVFLIGVTTAGWTTRAFGVQPTLLCGAGAVGIAGMLSFLWGGRVAAARAAESASTSGPAA